MRWLAVERCGNDVTFWPSTKISQSGLSAKFHRPITVASCEISPLALVERAQEALAVVVRLGEDDGAVAALEGERQAGLAA